MPAIEAEQVGRAGGGEAGFAAAQVEPTAYQIAAVEAGEQLLEVWQRRGEFQDKFEGAAAGQAEAVGLVGTDAIAHHLGQAAGHAGAAVSAGVAVNEVVLDAAARDTADHTAVAAQSHHRANRAGGGTPGAGDRGEQGAVAGGEPVSGGAQDQQVDAFHGDSGKAWGFKGAVTASSRVNPLPQVLHRS
ncbi:protein of unknown function [Pseudomonas sp. JV551A1]|nr:protein of unknown function [Pseudomonas sp. JV551A1]